MRAALHRSTVAVALAALGLTACGPSAEDVIADAERQAAEARAEAEASAEAIAADIEAQVSEALEDADAQAADAQASAAAAAEDAAGQLESAAGSSGGLTASDKPEPEAAEGAAAADAEPTPTTPDPTADLAGGRFDIQGLADATNQLREVLGTEQIELLQVQLLQGGRTTFQVRDPDMPENVDQYTWNGVSLSSPEPVQLVGGGDLDASVFPIAEVRVDGAMAAYDAAVGLGIEGGEVASMTMWITPFGDGLAWSVPVSGTRESKVVYAAPDGTVIRVA